MDTTFKLKCGKVLHLKPLKPQALLHLILKFGPNAMRDPEKILNLTGDARFRALEAKEQLFNYCAGWGVEELPSNEEVEELRELGVSAGRPRLARANWLRFLLLEDEDEAGALIAAVMAATFAPEPEPEPEQTVSEVEALKSQVAEMQAKLFEMTEKESDGG